MRSPRSKKVDGPFDASGLPGARPLLQSVSMQRCWGAFVLALATALPRASAADVSESGSEIELWVPAFALYFDALGQKASGSITSGDVEGPPVNGGADCNGIVAGRLCVGSPLKLRPDTADHDTDVAPLVGASLELMSPRLFEGLLHPRLFVHGDAALSFGFERNLAHEGTPGPFAPPPPREGESDVPEVSVSGQGSRAKAQLDQLVLSAGAGVAFSLDVLGRRLRIKPSFEYLHEEIDLIASLRRAVKQQRTVQPGTLDGYRFVVLTADDTQRFDGIGPGLEIEADAARWGPFLLSVFGAGRGYYLLGDLEQAFTASNEFGESATWSFDRERWAWRAGGGVRFRWVPE
jgi:hypothetical protein